MKKTVFLCGPMRGVNRNEALAWRKEATKMLSKKFNVLHAMRGREDKETFEDYRAAIIRDKNDIIKSEIILVNDSFLNASMIGSAMEILYAFNQDKIIIAFGNAHEKDYWLNYHIHTRSKDLKEACALINRMFS